MKKSLSSSIVFLLVLFASCATVIPQEKCDVPIWNVGDSWRFRRSDMKEMQVTVERIEEDLYIVNDYYASLLKCYDRKDLGAVAQINPEGKKEKLKYPSVFLIDFPVYVGKKWKKMLRVAPGIGAPDITYLNEYRVTSYEDVAVPAGTFKAFKIEMKQTNYAGFASGKVHYWYSPEVKFIIKREFEKISYWKDSQDDVLIRFELKDKQPSSPQEELPPQKVETTPKPQKPLPEEPKIPVPSTPPSRTNIVVVTGTYANIRSGAGNEFPIATAVKQGDKLILLGEHGEWFNVRLENGQEGWISNKYVK